jgi:hypothetical protein
MTVAQRELTRWAFGRAIALQVGVVAVAVWAWLVVRPVLATDNAGV